MSPATDAGMVGLGWSSGAAGVEVVGSVAVVMVRDGADGGGGEYLADSTVLPGVFALTSRSLCDLGFRETTIGSKGSSSSLRFCQMVAVGTAGW